MSEPRCITCGIDIDALPHEEQYCIECLVRRAADGDQLPSPGQLRALGRSAGQDRARDGSRDGQKLVGVEKTLWGYRVVAGGVANAGTTAPGAPL